MAERVAAAEIYIGVRDDEALANLRRIQQTFDRTMSDIDRSEAEATVGANLAPLKDDLANAKRLLRQLEKEEADLGVGISDEDKARLKKDIAEARRLIKSIDGEVATVEIEVHGEREAIKAQQAVEKATRDRIEAEDKLLRDLEKTRADAARRETNRVNREARTRESLNRQRLRELSTAEREAYQRERELREVPRLEQAYVGLHDKLEKLNQQRLKARRPFDERAMLRIGVEERVVQQQIDDLRKEIHHRTGRNPIEVPIRPELGRRWGEELRVQFGKNNGVLSAVALTVGLNVGRSMRTGIRSGLDQGIRSVGANAAKTLGSTMGRGLLTAMSRIGHAAGSLADSTVRIGPFTTTIRKAIMGLSLFAPLILDTVGALSTLVGSVGSATLGIGALGIAVAGGGIPAMLGMGIVIKQVVGEFADVTKAQKAYDDALQKNNTELAAKKMKELKAIMGNVSKETVNQIGQWDKVQASFKKATAPARAAVWGTIGEGIKTASAMMPMFTQRTNEAMTVATNGVNKWMKGLRSAAGQSAISEMMGNFSQFLAPVLDGMGSLLAYFGRVGQIASRVLPGMGRGFSAWARGINSVDTDTLTEKVNGVLDSAKALGRFLMSGGRLMKAFFGAGVGSGNDFLDVMTNTMNQWTRWTNSMEGKNTLKSFFSESVDGVRALWNTLGPVVSSFVRWAANIAPFARAFFEGAAAVGSLVSEFLRLTGLRGPVTALITTLGVLWGIGKIRTAVTAVQGFVTALFGVTGAQNATAAAAGRNTAALNAQATAATRAAAANRALAGSSTLAVGGAAANVVGGAAGRQVASNTAAAATRAAKLKSAVNGASLALLGMRAATAGTVGAVGILGYGLYKLSTRASDAEVALDAAKQTAEQTDAAISALPMANDASYRQGLGLESASLSVKQLRQQLRGLTKGSLEYKQTLNQIKYARQQERDEAGAMLKTMNDELRVRTDAKESAYQQMQAAKAALTETKEKVDKLNAAEKDGFEIGNQGAKAREEHAKALAAFRDAQSAVREANQQTTLSMLNQERAMAKLPPMATTAAAAMHRLQKLGGRKMATTISLKYDDPNKAARVGQAAARALKTGAGRGQVMKIIADSRSVDEALRRLNRARITPKEVKIVEKGGKEAVAMVERITGKRIPAKDAQIIERGGDKAIRKLAEILGIKLPKKWQDIAERGSNTVFRTLRRIAGFNLGTSIKNIIERGGSNVTARMATIRAVTNLGTATKNIVTWLITKRKAAGGPAYASGGPASRPDPRQGDRAEVTAALSGTPKPARSQKVNRPRYLVGEEATPEIVVATNPAYRQENRKYAAMAARMVGLEVSDPATGAPIRAAKGFSPFGKFKKAAFNPDAVIQRKKQFKPKKAKKRPKKINRGWANYIEGLETQQGYWEREVSIRESKIREPEDTIIRDPARDKVVKDPVSGEEVKVEAYQPNPKIEKEYKPDLARVLEAMKTLMNIVKELVRAIPLAMQANRTEYNYREGAITDLNADIKREKKKLKDGKKKNNKAAENRIEKATRERDRHKEEQRALNDDHKSLKESRVEAGFDWREYNIARKEYQNEYDTAFNEATQQATEDTLAQFPTGGSGGSGGGSGGSGGSGGDSGSSGAGGLSYDAQAALADTAKASILREFGSNFSPTSGGGGAGTAGSGLGQGAQASLAALGAVGTSGRGAGAADLTSARSAVASSSQAATTIMGGATSTGGAGGGTSISTTEGDKTIIVQAQFAEVPPDPHTFVKGVEFEVAGII